MHTFSMTKQKAESVSRTQSAEERGTLKKNPMAHVQEDVANEVTPYVHGN